MYLMLKSTLRVLFYFLLLTARLAALATTLLVALQPFLRAIIFSYEVDDELLL